MKILTKKKKNQYNRFCFISVRVRAVLKFLVAVCILLDKMDRRREHEKTQYFVKYCLYRVFLKKLLWMT